MLLGIVREINVFSDWFGCILVVSYCVAKLSWNCPLSRLPVSPIYNFLQLVRV